MNDCCPICGEQLKVRRWYEDGHLVETDKQCKCGYHYSDSYGVVEVTGDEQEGEE